MRDRGRAWLIDGDRAAVSRGQCPRAGGEVGGEGEGGVDVVVGDFGEAGTDVVTGYSGGRPGEHVADGDAHHSDERFAAAFVGFDGD